MQLHIEFFSFISFLSVWFFVFNFCHIQLLYHCDNIILKIFLFLFAPSFLLIIVSNCNLFFSLCKFIHFLLLLKEFLCEKKSTYDFILSHYPSNYSIYYRIIIIDIWFKSMDLDKIEMRYQRVCVCGLVLVSIWFKIAIVKYFRWHMTEQNKFNVIFSIISKNNKILSDYTILRR